jgi:hypothetical protein
MTDQLPVVYPYRHKMDGSFDSICLNCLGTLVAVIQTAESADADMRHACDPSFSFKRDSRAA